MVSSTPTSRSMSVFLFGVAAAALTPALATAADADFYKGKQIQLVVSTAAGGADDTFARVMAEHWPRHIPGNPTMIVQNMPGASGIKAGNYMYSVAPKDGTVIAAVHSNVPIAPVAAPEGALYDMNKINWIGSITKEPYVGFVSDKAPIKSFEDARKTQAIMGAQSASSVGSQFALLSNALAGTKMKLVVGYAGSPGLKLAYERGEIDGTFANTWSAIKLQQSKELQEGKTKLIIQHGLTKLADLSPDIPLMIDQVSKEEDKQAMRLALSIQEFAKPYLAPPGIPAERLETLRRSFDATVRDPQFVAAAAKMKLEVNDPVKGEALAVLLGEISKTPSSVSKRVEAIYDEFKGSSGGKEAKEE